jgi:hypothetical protein
MRRLWVGMLLASLPLALPAQTLDRPPQRNDLFNPAPRPPDDPAMPASPDVEAAPLPPDDSVTATPLPPPTDDSVTSTPLPPPDQQDNSIDSSQQMVPNPLDSPNAPPVPGAGGQSQPQGQTERGQTERGQTERGQTERGTWVQMGTATLQALDKVNAIEKTLVVKVGDTGHFGSLDIAVRGCYVRGADRPADATAFLVIHDQRPDAPSFNGWMIRSAPYMSMLAHPIYDVRVTGCS